MTSPACIGYARNRMVAYPSGCFHSATRHFGGSNADRRLYQTFRVGVDWASFRGTRTGWWQASRRSWPVATHAWYGEKSQHQLLVREHILRLGAHHAREQLGAQGILHLERVLGKVCRTPAAMARCETVTT